MSARRSLVTLSSQASQDYDDIVVYSLRHWGDQQTATYKAALDKALLTLGEFPEIGQARPDLGMGYRILRVEQHVIYYEHEIAGNTIRIDRILHRRMDAAGRLGG